MSLKDNVARIKEVASLLDDDDPDKIEMLNLEGDYTRLMEWALTKYAEHIATSNACKALKGKYADRQKSFENKAESIRGLIKWFIDSAGERKYTGAAGTVSVTNVKPKPVVTDESLVPDDYKKTTVSIDKSLINRAVKDGFEIDGVAMDNGGETICIRI